MADDLDQLIRAAMKTLDDEVPSGYFEALPNQTIARLEGSSMQHGSSGTTQTRDTVSPPPVVDSDSAPAVMQPAPVMTARQEEDREDSGLHDIRNLAQSTKQRLSSRRITTPPIADDVLASSSGSFKNIALPQPANMVSLPAVDELPSKADIAAAEKAAKKAAKEARKSEPKLAAAAPAAAAIDTPAAAVAPAAPVRQAFTLPSQQKRGKGPLLAVVGLGVAAAAGAVIFMQMQKSDQAASAPAADTTVTAAAPPAPAAPAVTAEPIAPPPAPEAAPVVEAPKEEAPAAGAAQLAADDVKADEAKADPKATRKNAKVKGGGKSKDDKDKAAPTKIEAAPEKIETKKPVPTKGSGEEGEPSFDALLKEAGVGEKKEAKPVLEKKSLTGDDFKKGMSSVASKAKGCYKGTQGTAMVKLTVAPSGSVSKIAVSGEFAGKPEGACVESALKGASFPAWDGGPQSFTYSVLLSD